MKFSTKAIHAGCSPDPTTGAVMPPIYMTSTFAQEAPGEHRAYEYTRAGNPNFTILEQQLAALENAAYATVFSSGLGAMTALASTLKQGDRVASLGSVYGGTYRLFHRVFSRFGVTWQTIEGDVEKVLETKPKWLLFETPTNPLLEIYDIAALCKIAKRHGVLVIVDNTFATPYNQNPLHWGADVVWHSSTKYLGGHSDVIGGVAMTNSDTLKQELDFARKALGLNPSPFDCWLVTRGVKTLALRMQQHQANAQVIAEYLQNHPLVNKVYYPGLPHHAGHSLTKNQMRGFGGMLSVEFNLSLEKTMKLISSFQIFTLAESLGGVESLVCHPASMTHASIPTEERAQLHITDGLIRFSVGIEDVSDLLDDLNQTLALM